MVRKWAVKATQLQAGATLQERSYDSKGRAVAADTEASEAIMGLEGGAWNRKGLLSDFET